MLNEIMLVYENKKKLNCYKEICVRKFLFLNTVLITKTYARIHSQTFRLPYVYLQILSSFNPCNADNIDVSSLCFHYCLNSNLHQ